MESQSSRSIFLPVAKALKLKRERVSLEGPLMLKMGSVDQN